MEWPFLDWSIDRRDYIMPPIPPIPPPLPGLPVSYIFEVMGGFMGVWA